jgi:dTDP-4-dehydrorhamnose reductase
MKIVIIGSGGRLGAALMREYGEKYDVAGFNHAQLDLMNLDEIQTKMRGLPYDILINAAALTNVDLCEREPGRAFQINGEAPRVLAEISRAKNAKLIHFSTDYVFDGDKREPYREEDLSRPISVYGESKRAGENSVLKMDDCHLVVRVSWVFGPERPSFVEALIARARQNEQIEAVADKFSTPTYTRDVAKILPGLFTIDVPGGILHFTNAGACSWREYAQHALDCCRKFGVGLKATEVAPVKLSDMKNFIARRPVYSVLSTAKYKALTGTSPRSWRDAVAEYIREFVAQ